MTEEIDYLYGIPKFSGKNPLENTKELLRRLNHPENSRKIIHVAGTNGKGSTCAYLDSILRKMGYRVGLFTSPHLVRINERIVIQGEPVSDREFERSFLAVRRIAREMEEDGFSHPSFFEFLFGMGMELFAAADVEYIVLETGLGGRLDATNAVTHPVLTVITSVGLDHTEILGNTYEQIAAEKAGIMKEGVPVVFADERKEVAKTILARAHVKHAPVFRISPTQIQAARRDDNYIDFSLRNGYYDNELFCVRSGALYQAENASLALTAVAALQMQDQITAIKDGLLAADWKGRMQRLRRNVIIDGAHNEDGIRRFLESVRTDGCSGDRLLVFGAAADKHYREMIDLLCRSGLFSFIAAGSLSNVRGLRGDRLFSAFDAYSSIPVVFADSVLQAYRIACERMKETDLLYAAGSLYLVGELLSLEKNKGNGKA